MPEKQICGKCGHEIEVVETPNEWSQFYGKQRLVHKGSGTVCLVEGCNCCKPEPQILCRNCGKPKGEHHGYGTTKYYCKGFYDVVKVGEIMTEFEPARQS